MKADSYVPNIWKTGRKLRSTEIADRRSLAAVVDKLEKIRPRTFDVQTKKKKKNNVYVY